MYINIVMQFIGGGTFSPNVTEKEGGLGVGILKKIELVIIV